MAQSAGGRHGRRGQSEWELAHNLLAQLLKRALLLADRLYGCAAFAVHAAAACERVGSHFLLHARTNITPRLITRLADGSRVRRWRDGRRPRGAEHGSISGNG